MDRFDLHPDPPYQEVFEGLLSFSKLADAEETIRRLEILRRQYLSASDKKGVEYCRRTASLGRRRAELISRNRRVNRQKQLQKKEIAAWFKIWLETPDIFMDWLALRKETAEYRKLLECEDVRESGSGE